MIAVSDFEPTRSSRRGVRALPSACCLSLSAAAAQRAAGRAIAKLIAVKH
jgi:hypothetical protein